MKTILLVGATGNTGQCTAKLLLQRTKDFKLIIGGRNPDKIRKMRNSLLDQYPDTSIEMMVIDLKDASTFKGELDNIDLLLNVSSAVGDVSELYVELLRSGTDYFDSNLSLPAKHEILRKQEQAIMADDLTFITDCGYHPGIPGAMVRWANENMKDLTEANCYAVMKIDWKSLKFAVETGLEMIEEFKHFQPLYFDETWKKWNYSKFLSFTFSPPFGKENVTPMFLEELGNLPKQIQNLTKTGFFIGGFNPVMDYFLMMVILLGIKVLPRSMYHHLARLFVWGAGLTRPPYGVQLVGVFKSSNETKKMTISHPDAYFMTAAPIVACVEQYLGGSLSKGLNLQALAVQPGPFFKAIEEMGVSLSVDKA